MTSYGSYNPVNKPVILDSVVISISNCGFSFIAGFAVWTVVGYLAKLGQLDESKTAGIGLAFFTYSHRHYDRKELLGLPPWFHFVLTWY